MPAYYTELFPPRYHVGIGDGMSDAKVYYRVRPSVYAFTKLCTRLLEHSEHVPLTPQERETILLYTRKLVERFL
jgi:hypothetical protein